MYSSKLKTNDLIRNPLTLHFTKNSDSALCVYSHFVQYVPLTAAARPYVIATLRAPHKRASADTISRYVKQTLTDAGVNTAVYTPYTCRHASTSAASRDNIPLTNIMQSAGWRAASTYSRFYKRPVLERTETNFLRKLTGMHHELSNSE